MRSRHLAATAILAAGLLAGCTPTTTPAGTITPPPTTTATTAPSTATTPTPTGDEAQITAQLQGYAAWASRAYADPSVSVNEAALYLWDEDPDYVMTAVAQDIVKFRREGYTETGVGTTTVISMKPTTTGGYEVRTCDDSSQIVVRDAQGQKVDTGPLRSATVKTVVKGVDGKWRIIKIQGVGTC